MIRKHLIGGFVVMNRMNLLSLIGVMIIFPFAGWFMGETINEKIFNVPKLSFGGITAMVDCEGERVMILTDAETGEVISRCIQNPDLTPDQYRTDEWKAKKELCEDGQC